MLERNRLAKYCIGFTLLAVVQLAIAKLKVKLYESTSEEHQCFQKNFGHEKTKWMHDKNTFENTPYYIDVSSASTSSDPTSFDKKFETNIVLDLGKKWKETYNEVASQLVSDCEYDFTIAEATSFLDSAGTAFKQKFKIDVDFYVCVADRRAPGRVDSVRIEYTGGVKLDLTPDNKIKFIAISENNNPQLPAGVRNISAAIGSLLGGPLGGLALPKLAQNIFDDKVQSAIVDADTYVRGISEMSNSLTNNAAIPNVLQQVSQLEIKQPTFLVIYDKYGKETGSLGLRIPLTFTVPHAIACNVMDEVRGFINGNQ